MAQPRWAQPLLLSASVLVWQKEKQQPNSPLLTGSMACLTLAACKPLTALRKVLLGTPPHEGTLLLGSAPPSSPADAGEQSTAPHSHMADRLPSVRAQSIARAALAAPSPTGSGNALAKRTDAAGCHVAASLKETQQCSLPLQHAGDAATSALCGHAWIACAAHCSARACHALPCLSTAASSPQPTARQVPAQKLSMLYSASCAA